MSDQPQQQSINRGQVLTVSLPTQQWQGVLVLIQAASGALLAEIDRQCTAQLHPPHEPVMSFRRGNGAAEHTADPAP